MGGVRNLSYQIEFLPEAKKDLEKLNKIIQKIIKSKIIILSENPNNLKSNIKTLKGRFKGKSRLRVGDYRIIFQVQNEKITILIIAISY